MKIISVVGARPQFIKAAPVSRAIRRHHQEILVHTGQHYDYEMSQVFFEGLNLPAPDYDLGVGSDSHAEQTAKMLTRLEPVILDEKPEMVLVYGDTNSTLAAAVAAAKLCLPLAHVEAGLRSFNRSMPEEINRILTDRVSQLLFCPTQTSVNNLKRENVEEGVHLVGDVMFDVALEAVDRAEKNSTILGRLGVGKKEYLLATVHRAGNTDDLASLNGIVEAFLELGEPLVLPLHPRTKKLLENTGLYEKLADAKHITLTEPLGYLDFIMLQKNAVKILTDSGGVQKEACFHKVPCITLREDTEWVETVTSGWNVLVGADKTRILQAAANSFDGAKDCQGIELWDGRAAERISSIINASAY
ncbi:MAG: UDP-N-acetylglucosamine 2-epimerase (non-hydrolyzing) [Phycisphaerales bacterium]|nr:UDP-N-acetylglucosamine 2-epimerase (non-hydrolyzing) [Phycisphaerales bacterium]